MIKLVSLTGIHGAGKTTLANMLKDDGYHFVASQAKEIHDAHGYRTTDNIPFGNRVVIQRDILKCWMESIVRASKQHGKIVTDRSPLDFAAYMHLDIPRDLGGEQDVGNMKIYFDEIYQAFIELTVIAGTYLIRVSPWATETISRDDGRLSGNIWYNHLYQSAWHYHFYKIKTALQEGIQFAELSQHTVSDRYAELKQIIKE